jgi:GNAT superfamily N-acetyltransferase
MDTHPDHFFTEIAGIHIAQINNGMMAQLKINLLSRIYREIARHPGGGVWIAMANHKVAGFIAGSANTRKTFLVVILRLWLPLTLFTLKSLFNSNFIKFARIIFYPFRKVSDSSHLCPDCACIKPEILSLAVSKNHQNSGIGKKLILAFEEALKSWHYEGYYKVATDISETGSNNFYLSSGFSPCHKVKLNEMVLQVYVKKSIA